MQNSTFVGAHASTLDSLARTQQLPSNPLSVSSERKVWVGSIPASVSEQELKATLSRYGTICEFFCKPDNARLSRGWKWALVTYSNVEEARNAIEHIHRSTMFSNGDRPLEARFANVKDGSVVGLTPRVSANITPEDGAETAPIPSVPAPCSASNPLTANSGASTSSVPSVGPHQPLDLRSRESKGVASSTDVQSTNGEVKGSSSQSKVGKTGRSLWQIYHTPAHVPYYYNSVTRHVQWERPLPPKEHPDAQGQYRHHSGSANSRAFGPLGANLFIFHLPSSWTDTDLKQHFNCFGNVVSAHIRTDGTGRNSGFGFVSYDSPASAFAAIQVMNGLGISGKFLKVQLKKGEEHLYPTDEYEDNAQAKGKGSM